MWAENITAAPGRKQKLLISADYIKAGGQKVPFYGEIPLFFSKGLNCLYKEQG
jgi:hypothetical protein